MTLECGVGFRNTGLMQCSNDTDCNPSLDRLVGEREQVVGKWETEGLSGLEDVARTLSLVKTYTLTYFTVSAIPAKLSRHLSARP